VGLAHDDQCQNEPLFGSRSSAVRLLTTGVLGRFINLNGINVIRANRKAGLALCVPYVPRGDVCLQTANSEAHGSRAGAAALAGQRRSLAF
jgi:hypothetical protein